MHLLGTRIWSQKPGQLKKDYVLEPHVLPDYKLT